VAAGSRTPFTLAVPVRHLATRDPDTHTWRPPVGEHRLRVARHAEDPEATTVVVSL